MSGWVILLVNCLTVLWNMTLLAMVIKLYTEVQKLRVLRGEECTKG